MGCIPAHLTCGARAGLILVQGSQIAPGNGDIPTEHFHEALGGLFQWRVGFKIDDKTSLVRSGGLNRRNLVRLKNQPTLFTGFADSAERVGVQCF